MPCCEQGLLIEPNLQEFEKISANRPNAIAVNAAICSQEQLVHFVGKGAIIPLVGNSAGMHQVVFHTSVSHVLLVGPSKGFLKWTEYQGPGMFLLLALATSRQRVRATCVGRLL